MNLESYEQMSVDQQIIKDQSCWLQDGDECDVTIWNDYIIQIELPKFVTFTIESTVDAIKGDTVSSTLKEANLDNGITIMVPIFIKEGEKIKIDTETNEYSSRVKE